AWGLGFLTNLLPDPFRVPRGTGTRYLLIARSGRGRSCMGFITNTHGTIVPHDTRRGFCGAQVFSPEHEVALELRGGRLLTVINGERTELQPGNIWLVPKGTRLPLQAQGELAVLRAIYLISPSRSKARD